jgi:hypothetical protein
MKCKCIELPEVFYLEEGPKKFEKNLHQEGAENWKRLYSCPSCGMLWAIDEWDKYTWQVVSRVNDKNNWSTEERTEERKQLLLNSRGGTTEEECMWSNCKGKRVKNVAYCIDHLWNTGARK